MRNNPYMDSEDFDQCIDWNPHSNLEEEYPNIPDFNHNLSNALEGDKKRQSHKNKYINKITQIKPESTSNTKKRSLIEQQISLEPEELKKFKNREAAKESRQRKKLYINLMEQQIRKLEQDLQQTNKQIQICKIQIQKSTFNNNQSIGSFDSKLAHVFKKIEGLLHQQESEDRNSEFNMAIDSILYRFGATGKQRKNNINQSYKLILLLAFPAIHRYMAWSAREKTHMFLTKDSFNLDYEAWFSQIRTVVGNSITENQNFLQGTRTNIANNLEKMQVLTTQLNNGKHQIQHFCNILDSLITQIREILTPAQSAKLIIVIQKYKYRQQLHFLEVVATRPSTKSKEIANKFQLPPRKYIKLQEPTTKFQ